MLLRSLFCVLSVVSLSVLGGCPEKLDNNIVDIPPPPTTCSGDEDCQSGNLCVGGACRIAQCNPSIESVCGIDNLGEGRDPNCCKIFENCDTTTLACVRDPNATGIGCPPGEDTCIPCEENRDCVSDLGFQAFCSGGRCFAQQGLTSCTADFNCAETERCDRTEFFCVPDGGACRFCSADFPELCCSNGTVCDLDSGRCLELGDVECTAETTRDDCRAGEQCDANGRCVQCIDNSDCGPGTECNPANGLCRGTVSRCEVDNDCPQSFRCIDETCSQPACEIDRDCDDSREICQAFTCILPDAVCEETDEPNNAPSTATQITLAGGYGGLLCRGDSDQISFPVRAQKRYVVTVTIAAGNTPFNGLGVTLFDGAGNVESTAQFTTSSTLPLVGVTGAAETGRFRVEVNSGGNRSRDQWAYTVSVREEEASAEADCSAAAQASQEPNNDFAAAIALTSGQTGNFTRCGTGDSDFFKITVPPLNGVQFVVDGFFNAEGNINLDVFRGPSNGERVNTGATATDIETVSAPEGSVTYFAKVFLASSTGALSNQNYRIRAVAVPRPADCNADVGENDGVIESAAPMTLTTDAGLVSGELSALRCNPQDVDIFRFEVPARLGGAVRLAFTHAEGDLALDLLNEAGVQVATSNSSNAGNGGEAIDLPQSESAQTFYGRVRLGVTTGSPILAQAYTASVSTFDAGVCLDTEPTPDNTFATGRCVGTFDVGGNACNGAILPAPLVADFASCQATPEGDGCFRTCGSVDDDVYRIGNLEAGRTIITRLEFAPDDGDLFLQVAKITSGTNLATLATIRDNDNDGVIEVERLTTGSRQEHALIVRPDGPLGHEGQLYSLAVAISNACIADAFEVSGGNSTPATSTLLRDDPSLGEADEVVNASSCSGDVDVYEILAFAGETITVRTEGLVGARIRAGTRPANLSTPAITIAEGVADGGGIAEATFTSTRVQQIFLTVDRTTTDVGNYSLTIDYTAD